MNSVFYKITKQEVGETLLNFELTEGDLVTADRAYGTINGIEHCVKNKSDFILRLRSNCFNLYDDRGAGIDILSGLTDLNYERSVDFQAFVQRANVSPIPVRICAKRKSKESCENAYKRLNRKASKKQIEISEKTKRLNEFIVVVSSLPNDISGEDILETYRYRWQAECYFKRLKSVLNFGELPKKRENSSFSWLNGKMMVSLLIESLTAANFFPSKARKNPMREHLAGNQQTNITSLVHLMSDMDRLSRDMQVEKRRRGIRSRLAPN
jgi:transposase